MNEHLRHTNLPITTQAAEGLPRRRWTVAEIEAMVAGGILLEDERFELIGGEVVPMAPKGDPHEIVKKALQQHWVPLVIGSTVDLITETTLRVVKDAFFEPDFLFWPRSIALADITASLAHLIVEVSDTSLGYDLGIKALSYAKQGLPELWVINARTLVTTIHRSAAASGYTDVREAPSSEQMTPLLMPQLGVRLDQLDLG